jgi:hypothetical protein
MPLRANRRAIRLICGENGIDLRFRVLLALARFVIIVEVRIEEMLGE